MNTRAFIIVLSTIFCIDCVMCYDNSFNVIDKKIMNVYTLQSANISNELCKNQSAIVFQEFSNKAQWAIKMVDASSKIPYGLMSANLVDLGMFDQCLSVKYVTENSGTIRGQHCLVQMKIPFATLFNSEERISLNEKLRFLRTQLSVDFDDNNNPEAKALSYMPPLKWSICTPASCSSEDVKAHLEKSLTFLFNENVTVTVPDNACQSEESKPTFQTIDWVVIGFLILLVGIMLMSTIYDVYLHYSKKELFHPLCTAFSVFTNARKLTKVSRRKDQFHCLNGIRWFSMMWVISGHQFMINAFYPNVNGNFLIPWMAKLSSQFTIGSTVSVDSFFLMSGLLLMHSYMKQVTKKGSFNVPMFYLHRYLRLTPALAAAMVFHMTLNRYIGSGPLWPDTENGLSKNCYKYWWSTLLYVQNYVNPVNKCIDQTWYLSVDMQLFLLAPIVLYPIWRWPLKGLIFLGLLIATFIAVPFGISWSYELAITGFSNEYYQMYYFTTHGRAATFLLGIGLGYLLYKMQNQKVKFNKSLVALAWTASAVVMLAVVLGPYSSYQPGYVYNKFENVSYIAFARSAWCVALSWIIFSCVHGYGGPVNWLLSAPVFQVLGRLTYSMYLLHQSMIMYRAGTMRAVPHFTDLNTMFVFGGDVLFTSLLAIVWVLTFEMPMAIIDSLLIRKESSPAKRQLTEPPNKVDMSASLEEGQTYFQPEK